MPTGKYIKTIEHKRKIAEKLKGKKPINAFTIEAIKKRVETRKRNGWFRNPKQARKNISKGRGGKNSRTSWHRKSVEVMERKLGRKLKKGEVVHHIDGNPANNKEENLELFESVGKHTSYHYKKLKEKKIKNGTYKTTKQLQKEWYLRNRDRILKKQKEMRLCKKKIS